LGRRQARDYWVNLGVQCQTPFYCATNLELIELFKHDPNRARTSAQLIVLNKPITSIFGSVSDDLFYEALVDSLIEVLDIVFGNKSAIYHSGLLEFQSSIESAVDDKSTWHKFFIPACYEYIRGSFSAVPGLSKQVSSWKHASFYSSTPNRINQLGSAIDFNLLFCPPIPNSSDPNVFLPSVLNESFVSGRNLGRGDDIAELVNEILSDIPGVVETDAELAQLMGVISKVALGRDLLPEEEVLDPGAGSGSLIAVLPLFSFPNLSPQQVRAVEIEPRFSESLSLRLGLSFIHLISPNTAPKIFIKGIETIPKSEFSKVKLVVMNPPFLSGVQSVNKKGYFLKRIKELSGQQSKINDGQIGLEALFLELVCNLVSDETVISTIFPAQHLYRFSSEASKLRIFLTDHFGLTHIVFYPSKSIFKSVTKQTVMLVGKRGIKSADLTLVEVQKQVGELDFQNVYNQLTNSNISNLSTSGIEIKKISRSQLSSISDDGWKGLIGAGSRVDPFIKKYFINYLLIGNKARRGTVGNSGNTKLTVFNINNPRYPKVHSAIPKGWIRSVLNNTENMPRILNARSCKDSTLFPPQSAYVSQSKEHAILLSIVNGYLAIPLVPKGKQAVAKHTNTQVISKLKSDQKDLGSGWVLVQRASRKKGEIGLLEKPGILLSTNVILVKLGSPVERKLMGSWLLSIFGQLQLEFYSAPEEGMRKLEIEGVKKVCYPDFSSISINIKNKLLANFNNESSIDFLNVSIRPIDIIWASVVDPLNPSGCINSALNLLQELIDERKGFGDT
jgi:predicted RNA methylase